MSDIDLTEVSDALFRWNTPSDPYFVIRGRTAEALNEGGEDPYLPIVEAIAPHIARQVREQVADEIKTASKTLEYDDDEARVLHIAARIARGEQL